MSSKDSLGDRAKKYEGAFSGYLPGRMPILCRLDGKGFHNYTKGMKRPWDDRLNLVMDMTAKKLCEEISGAQFAYVQSDEISIFIHPYKTLGSQAYFDGKIQKIVSVSAAIASATFTAESDRLNDENLIRPAYFDSRVFVVPEADVANMFLWRQNDATRNSVQMLARSLYSHKECNNKNNSELQEMCFQKGHNWNDVPTRHKRGRCIVKEQYPVEIVNRDGLTETVMRSRWTVDEEIPVFSQDREYINKYLATEEE